MRRTTFRPVQRGHAGRFFLGLLCLTAIIGLATCSLVLTQAAAAGTRSYATLFGAPASHMFALYYEAVFILGGTTLCGSRPSLPVKWQISLIMLSATVVSVRLLLHGYHGLGMLPPKVFIPYGASIAATAWWLGFLIKDRRNRY